MRKLILGFVVVVAVGVVALARSAQTPAQPLCSLTDKGRFDLGWTQKTETGSYRCMPIFDVGLKPSGAAWVKVNTDGTIGRELPK